MSTQHQPLVIDALLTQIQATPNPSILNQTIKTGLSKESRDTLLSSLTSAGQDPLTLLDLSGHTIGVLYILSARLNANFQQHPPPSWDIVREFCRVFIPDHARLAPERVTKLAKGIQRTAQHFNAASSAIEPLRDLVSRYPYDPSFLTPIHPIFTLLCASTRHFTAALPLLSHPITDISLSLSPDLTYNDNLTYHYTGGIILSALKKWAEAEEFFEIVVTAPATYPAAIQLEALKKLRLVQLIWKGKTTPLPKYTHPMLMRIFKGTVYHAFVNAYPHNTGLLKEILDKEKSGIIQEKNLGLIIQALNRAPRWQLKKLTATYVTLHLTDIGKAVGITKEEDVRRLLLSMIDASDIHATLSSSGSVTFSDPPPSFSKSEVDSSLAQVQNQAHLLRYIDMEVGRSREFLARVGKTAGGGGGMGGGMGGMGGRGEGGIGSPEGTWDDEMFAAALAASGGSVWEEGMYS